MCDHHDFDAFFKAKGVDYRGEEVKIAQRFSWSSISPALPPEVGGVSLRDFCTLGTRYYVENFGEFLAPRRNVSWVVDVRHKDWDDLVRSLVCGVISLDDVCHIHGKPMLGGLFGVGKNEFIGSLETQRLIMNFVPLNENCRPWMQTLAHCQGLLGLAPSCWRTGWHCSPP